ncbi:exonuclease domain-containing protein [Microbulbifer yueqingensis]|uniref:DNA polymerase-3 subunit epsilon n=1 Tax=Microbulbifer yueqingensis TaxID=658219 RepID=A0A1G8UDP4_9GAMM|nr:exonuclease domain-containing protein [Microbulbifer yueqingensis]SDJ51842.1 DNA polymerase-3 subunit epsilon [Microbulbifer yueqingensis]
MDWPALLWLGLKRRWWRGRARHPALRRALTAPLPAGDAVNTRYVAVDLETTGLSPERDEIASIGWVAIEQGCILLETARHYRVRLEKDVGQSAIYHQLTDSELQQGEPLPIVLARLLEAIDGSVLIFHNAQLDMGFLNRACRSLWGAPLPVPFEDTMQLESRRLIRQQEGMPAGALRLFQCRRRYGLPDVAAHDALGDAIATAELWLAMNAGGYRECSEQ